MNNNQLTNESTVGKIYVYMGTYIYNPSGNDFRTNRSDCEFFIPAYSLYRELKSREELKIELYKEEMFELDNTVIKKHFGTMLESNKFFEQIREELYNSIDEDIEKPFVKTYQPNEKKTK